jgi:hypothetical protein
MRGTPMPARMATFQLDDAQSPSRLLSSALRSGLFDGAAYGSGFTLVPCLYAFARALPSDVQRNVHAGNLNDAMRVAQ